MATIGLRGGLGACVKYHCLWLSFLFSSFFLFLHLAYRSPRLTDFYDLYPIHLKVCLEDGTLDLRMLWLLDLTMRDQTALFPARSIPRWWLRSFWKTSNDHNSATRHPIYFVFGSRVGFSGTMAGTSLFPVRSMFFWHLTCDILRTYLSKTCKCCTAN